MKIHIILVLVVGPYTIAQAIYISFIRIVDVTKQVNADYDLKIEKQKMEYLEKESRRRQFPFIDLS